GVLQALLQPVAVGVAPPAHVIPLGLRQRHLAIVMGEHIICTIKHVPPLLRRLTPPPPWRPQAACGRQAGRTAAARIRSLPRRLVRQPHLFCSSESTVSARGRSLSITRPSTDV